jgi:hydrogenase maturation protein HypF
MLVRGAVQGVGFRPFAYRLAGELQLSGWVRNTPHGVVIEAEGAEERVRELMLRLDSEKPPLAYIQSLEPTFLEPAGYTDFEIRESDSDGRPSAVVLPDIATCPECLRELNDPSNRRYRYPFTNCTHCGPRFSIIESLPYDRARTTMKQFTMCPSCLREYEDPRDRRFHAQPNACPTCGPHVELWDEKGRAVSREDDAIKTAVEQIRDGRIVAVKGLGGFHLMVDAHNDRAVGRLRERKRREEKPFALMSPDLETLEAEAHVSDLERRLLRSPESPIVLLRKRSGGSWSGLVAPANPYVGAMLPYTPLHYLLLRDLGMAVVATSGNLSDEPICTDEREALIRLKDIADCFLVHNRPIRRHVDDSIVRIVLGREFVVRRARGYAPWPVRVGCEQSGPVVLGVGAHLKNTVAVSAGGDVYLSQHIGDLETETAYQAFCEATEQLAGLYELAPTHAACDLHPDYLSTRFARRSGLPVTAVQHHYAHILACMAENEVDGPCLGISWDGTGYGTDGTIWGGEFLRVSNLSFERAGYFRTFLLPGGDQAVREPRRSALGLLFELFHTGCRTLDCAAIRTFSDSELDVLLTALDRGATGVRTSSVGRLFDAAASMMGLRQRIRFEGQAAMELEFVLNEASATRFPMDIRAEDSAYIVDWEPAVHALLDAIRCHTPLPDISAGFHLALVHAAVKVARKVGEETVILSGGCFQNRYLLEQLVQALRESGFRPYWHQRIPTNDGGIALGQVVAARQILQREAIHVSRSSR